MKGVCGKMEQVTENLNKILIQKNTSLTDISRRANLSRTTLDKILRSNSSIESIQFCTLLKIAKTLDVDFLYLIGSGRTPYPFIENDYLKTFVENTKKLLEEKNRKQKSLSSSPGISEATVSNLLTGKSKNPRMRVLYSISMLLEESMEKIFSEGSV